MSVKDTTSGKCADATGAFTVNSCTTNFVATSGTTSWSFAEAATNLTDGDSYSVTVETIDNVGNTNASAQTATWTYDTTAPTATNVVLANGGTLGRADSGDTLTVTYSEAMDPSTFCPGIWLNNGTSQSRQGNGGVVIVTITNNGANDILTVAVTGCTGGFKFVSVALNADYVGATTTFNGNGSGQSIVAWNQAAKTMTITLGSGTGSATGVAASIPSYTADTGLTDVTGNAIGAGPYPGTSSRF